MMMIMMKLCDRHNHRQNRARTFCSLAAKSRSMPNCSAAAEWLLTRASTFRPASVAASFRACGVGWLVAFGWWRLVDYLFLAARV